MFPLSPPGACTSATTREILAAKGGLCNRNQGASYYIFVNILESQHKNSITMTLVYAKPHLHHQILCSPTNSTSVSYFLVTTTLVTEDINYSVPFTKLWPNLTTCDYTQNGYILFMQPNHLPPPHSMMQATDSSEPVTCRNFRDHPL